MFNVEHIKARAQVVVDEKRRGLDAENIPKELEALAAEITRFLVCKGEQYRGLMDEYHSLMQKEQELFDPVEAVIAGRNRADKEKRQAFYDYLRSVAEKRPAEQALSDRDALYIKIRNILDAAQRPLLDEYNELFRKYYGILCREIERFFDLGYNINK